MGIWVLNALGCSYSPPAEEGIVFRRFSNKSVKKTVEMDTSTIAADYLVSVMPLGLAIKAENKQFGLGHFYSSYNNICTGSATARYWMKRVDIKERRKQREKGHITAEIRRMSRQRKTLHDLAEEHRWFREADFPKSLLMAVSRAFGCSGELYPYDGGGGTCHDLGDVQAENLTIAGGKNLNDSWFSWASFPKIFADHVRGSWSNGTCCVVYVLYLSNYVPQLSHSWISGHIHKY